MRRNGTERVVSPTFRASCSSEYTLVIMITDIAASAKSKALSGPRREVASARSLGTAWASTTALRRIRTAWDVYSTRNQGIVPGGPRSSAQCNRSKAEPGDSAVESGSWSFGGSVGWLHRPDGRARPTARRLWSYRPWLADDTRPCRSAEEGRGTGPARSRTPVTSIASSPGGIDWIEMM